LSWMDRHKMGIDGRIGFSVVLAEKPRCAEIVAELFQR
jgi:hypothetical protein